MAVYECARKGAFLPFKETFHKAVYTNIDPPGFEAIPSLWRTLIERYSAFGFTFESDRLPALSGIVAMFENGPLPTLLCRSLGRQLHPRYIVVYGRG